jgi:hypothetical protein
MHTNNTTSYSYYFTPQAVRDGVHFCQTKKIEFGEAVKQQPIQIFITDVALAVLAFMVKGFALFGLPIGLALGGVLLLGSVILTLGLIMEWKEVQGTLFTKGKEAVDGFQKRLNPLKPLPRRLLICHQRWLRNQSNEPGKKYLGKILRKDFLVISCGFSPGKSTGKRFYLTIVLRKNLRKTIANRYEFAP